MDIKKELPEHLANVDVKHLYHKLTCNGCYIVRPRTEFTNNGIQK
jgi:hypothetical protein